MPGDKQSFRQGDETWHKLRHKSLDDLYWFNEVILGYGDLVPMRRPVHYLLCRFAERKTGSPILDTARYQLIAMPRTTGKTTLITTGRAIQQVCRDPNTSILIANEKAETASDILMGIQHHFESNELLRALFPEVIPADFRDTTWNKSRMTVQRATGRKEPTIFVVGVGGTVTGLHPDSAIVDDAISREAMENARNGSWQIMHQTNRWIHQLEPLVNFDAQSSFGITFIGTRWWHNDCYEHIEEAYSYGEEKQSILLRLPLDDNTIQQLTAYRAGDLAIFRRAAIEDGRSIFPDKWSLEDLSKIRQVDAALFSCNYMNLPSDEASATFKPSWLKTFNWLDNEHIAFTDGIAHKQVLRLGDLDRLILVDPGGFSERPAAEDRARACAIVVGDDLQGHKFLLDCYAERDSYLSAIKHIVNWAVRYRPRRIYVERAGQQVAFASLLRDALAKQSVLASVDDSTLKPTQAKDIRILEIEPYFQRGEIFVGTGPAFHEFQIQYTQYPRAARLDVLDVLGYWPQLMKRPTATYSADAAKAAALSTYRMRRGWRGLA